MRECTRKASPNSRCSGARYRVWHVSGTLFSTGSPDQQSTVHCLTIDHTSTAPGSLPISTRCAPSAPTRPAFTSRRSRSRISQSLQWLVQRLPEAGLTRRDRRHRQRARHQHETRSETVGRLASRKPELRRLARRAARRGLRARSRPRDQCRSGSQRHRRGRGLVRRGRTFRLASSAPDPMSAR